VSLFLSFVVARYGSFGPELINITYVGDTLIATKATGDTNVPRGQVSFTVDLAPSVKVGRVAAAASLKSVKVPNPPPLSDGSKHSSRQAGTSSYKDTTRPASTSLSRYNGKGQIAKPGFKDQRFVEGQFVVYDNSDCFCFVWVPTSHVVFFQRPTSDQILNLLRDTLAQEDAMENMRRHLTTCLDLDMTTSLARQFASAWEDHDDDLSFSAQTSLFDSISYKLRSAQAYENEWEIDPTDFFRRISFRDELLSIDQGESDSENISQNTAFWNISKWSRSFFDGMAKMSGALNEICDPDIDKPNVAFD
jgi:hypothetical protein